MRNVVYYESIKRERNKRLIFECRCDTRLKTKAEGSIENIYVYVSIRARLNKDVV